MLAVKNREQKWREHDAICMLHGIQQHLFSIQILLTFLTSNSPLNLSIKRQRLQIWQSYLFHYAFSLTGFFSISILYHDHFL